MLQLKAPDCSHETGLKHALFKFASVKYNTDARGNAGELQPHSGSQQCLCPWTTLEKDYILNRGPVLKPV
jgi:hypothetical protein